MRQLKDAVKEWPPSNYGGFYTRGNNISLKLRAAKINDVSLHGNSINITVSIDNDIVSATLDLIDTSISNQIYKALTSAIGSSLEDAGKLAI